jgi:very-short-patch-repair endonuclease
MKKKSIEEVQEEINNYTDEFKILEQIKINKENHYKIKHLKCGYEFISKLSNFRRRYSCPKCVGKVYNKNSDYFKNEIKNIDSNYELISEYKNCHTHVKIKHLKCGYEYLVTPTRFLSGDRCPKCSKRIPKTTKMFKEEIYKLVGKEYVVLDEYPKNNKINISFKHNKCNSIFKMSPHNFLRGQRCPECYRKELSKKANYIYNLLKSNNIKVKKEKTYKDCKDKSLLKFDFFLKDYNCIIEFDGLQHFDKKSFMGKTYKTTHKHDLMKNEFCKNNKINLIRIPYKLNENEIKNIIMRIIKEKDLNNFIEKYDLFTIINEDITNEIKYYDTYNL